MESDQPLIKISNLKKVFGDVEVLKDISLSIFPGTVTTFLGPSGTGKSTLLRCINQLETPTAGEVSYKGVLIDGSKITLKQMKKNIGMVFQHFDLFPHMTILGNITYAPRKVLKLSKAAAEKRALALLDEVGLSDKKDAYPEMLSGGQQQRVAIARALAMDPEILFFDEPTSALDPEMVNEVLRVIKKLANQGMTMLLVTHEMNFAKNVSDKICFMDNGYIVEKAAPKEFFAHPKSERAKQFLSQIM